MTANYYDPRTRDPSLSRRPNNRRDDEWIRALLARVRVGRVSTVWVGDDGEAFPFITPLAFAYRPEHHDIVYHTNIAGRLRANTSRAHLSRPAPPSRRPNSGRCCPATILWSCRCSTAASSRLARPES